MEPMIIFSDCMDPIWKSRERIGSLKRLKKLVKLSEGTLIVSNLKMINKMSTFPPWKNFCARLWMIVLSRFHSLRIVCFFPFSFRLQNKKNQPVCCYYFIKITCNGKYFTQLTMGVVDYSKRQLKTVVGSQFEEHWSKPHPSNYAHLLQHTR